jgi:hypothetical protein
MLLLHGVVLCTLESLHPEMQVPEGTPLVRNEYSYPILRSISVRAIPKTCLPLVWT